MKITSMARKVKRQDIHKHEQRILSAASKSKFWTFVRSKMTCKTVIPVIKGLDGNINISPLEKANAFNSFFKSVFVVDDGITYDGNTECNFVLENVDFSYDIVLSHIKRLASKHSSGPDGLPQSFIQNLAIYLATPFSLVFQRSFQMGELPNAWKISKVTPLHKKDSQTDVRNYRPISQLCCAGKIIESIVRGVLMDYMYLHNIITSDQHGFMTKRSTVT